MRLKCYINGSEYNVLQGATFNEEYNETLDSGTIILDQVSKINDLRPYDDVFVYSVGDDEDEFVGYRNSNSTLKTLKSTVREETQELVFDKREVDAIFKSNDYIVQNQTIRMAFILRGSNAELQERNFEFLLFADTYGLRYYTGIVDGEPTYKRYQLEVDGNDLIFYYGDDYSTIGADNYDVIFVGYCAIRVRYNTTLPKPSFYKHLLVYQYTEERLNPTTNLYKYKIELCSETKKLETIQLPNISITQPLEIGLKKSVYDYARQFLNQYNPKIKMDASRYSRQWMYRPKYEFSSEIYEIFDNVYCPDFTLDNPSLKDVLHQLFLTKDRIPLVKDDVIYALDITARNGAFNTNGVYSITGSMSLDNYADNLKRTYTDAISEKNTARRVEFLGFRNSNNALMTLGNMRLETKYPIYKINKVLMCYYKFIEVEDLTTQTTTKKVFLCKQDITPLVLLEQVRNQLSEDWEDWENMGTPEDPYKPTSIEDMARFKLCTVGYSIGGTTIEGWGTTYNYPQGWWDVEKSYIENIFDRIDALYPYGIYTEGYIAEQLGLNSQASINSAVSPIMNIATVFTGGASRLKSFFFEVEYEAFYNGTIITSKDGARDDITNNDNASSSLTILEKDGLFQKEKANRFGNMAYSIRANYDDISNLQELGTVYEDDVIIYSREYQIWTNVIRASYNATKDYVLKNYYTSVYSKHRPYAMIDYSQSIVRAENKKMFVMLSKDTLYYEELHFNETNLPLSFNNFDGYSFLDEIVSFAMPSEIMTSIDKQEYNQKINFGYFEDGLGNRYASDINTFVNSYSLCFNIQMWDNITMGNYIARANPSMNQEANNTDYATGSVQNFYKFVDSTQTGFKNTMYAYVSHIPEKTNFNDTLIDDYNDLEEDLYAIINALPQIEPSLDETNRIGNFYSFYKDNKEVIDLTMQIEAFTNDENIVFSEWMLRLSELNGNYQKISETYEVKDTTIYTQQFDLYTSGEYHGYGGLLHQFVIIKIPISLFNTIQIGDIMSGGDRWWYDDNIGTDFTDWFIAFNVGFGLNFLKLAYKSNNKIGIQSNYSRRRRKGLWGGYSYPSALKTMYFQKITRFGDMDFSNDTDNYYFANAYENDGLWFYYDDNGFELGKYFTNGYYYEGLPKNLETGFKNTKVKICSQTGETKTYNQNMFIKLDTNPIKKTLVYDEYAVGDITFSNLKVEDIIVNHTQEVATKIIRDYMSTVDINLAQIPSTTKSIQMWYNDNGTLHFVFGVNVDANDYVKGYVRIYLSTLSKRDTRVYNENHLVIGKIKNFVGLYNEDDYGKYQLYEITQNN